MIFQHFNLLDRLTVFENIAYPLKHIGLTKIQIEEKVNDLLKFVDLEEKEMSILHSFLVDKSKELRLQEHLQMILRFYFLMKQHQL